MTAVLNAEMRHGVVEEDSAELLWPAGGHRQRRVVSGQPGGALHHRPGADGRWRNGDVNGSTGVDNALTRLHESPLRQIAVNATEQKICDSGLDASRNVA